MMPISTVADARDLLICRNMNLQQAGRFWLLDGQQMSGKELVQIARALDGGDAPSKYGNTRVEVDGFWFGSIAESNEYGWLKVRQTAGEISDLEVHPRFELRPAFRDTNGRRYQPMYYVADFSFVEKGKIVVVDIKGVRTDVYVVKRDLFIYHYPHIEFREIEA